MHVRRHVTLIAALCASLVIGSSAASGQVASALLVEDGPIPGSGGETISALNNTAVNHVGGYAVSITTNNSISLIWGDPAGGSGTVLRTESTIGDLEQTSFESFYGISDAGNLSYSASSTNTVTGTTGLDGVWLDDTFVALEEEPVVSLPGFFWSFASRPGVTASGVPYWVGGYTDTAGTSTQERGLFFGAGATVLLTGGDPLPNSPFPIDEGSSNIDFDYRFSAEASHYILPVLVDSGSTLDDGVMTYDGAGLLLDGQLVRESSPVPAAVGGLPGEEWDNFDFMGATEDGKYLFTGDTDADTSQDEFVAVNGQIQFREGDVADGFVLSGSIEGAYMNEQGDVAFIWDIDTTEGNVEALYFNGGLLLKEGDAVDLDGDGVVEPDSILANFTGISALTVGDQGPGGVVNVYFTADIDTEGTSSSTDDVEGYFCVPTQGAECFLVFGGGPGSDWFMPGTHEFDVQVGDVAGYWAVTQEDIPEFVLPDLQLPFVQGQQIGGGSVDNVTEFSVQVVMWNPYVFPEQPEQYTHGLHVRIEPGQRVKATPYGASTGMRIWAELDVNESGQRVIRFPFSIPGL
jgi:hypothetical protein